MAKPTSTPSRSVEVCAEMMDADDGMLGDETFDWFDLSKRKDFLTRMDKLILQGGYFQIKPT